MKHWVLAAAGLTWFSWIPVHQTCRAGGCYPQQAVQQVVAYQQPTVAYSYYFVGQPIREQALVQKAVQDDPLWQEFQEFKRWREQNVLGQSAQGDQRSEIPQPMLSKTIVQATCLKCHSGDEPKGDLRLDGSLSDSTKLNMMKMVWAGKMPPTAPLNNEQAAELFEELLGESVPKSAADLFNELLGDSVPRSPEMLPISDAPPAAPLPPPNPESR